MYKKLLLFLGFFIPFSFALSPTKTIDLNILKLFIPIIFLFWLTHSLLSKKIIIDTRPRFWLLLIFLFITIISFFWTTAPEEAIRKILFFVTTIPLYFAFYSAQKFTLSNNTESKTFLDKFLKSLFWGAFAVSVLALLFFILQFIIGLNPTLNILRSYTAPIFLGQSMSTLVNQYSSWLVNISGKTILRTFGTFPDPHLFSLYLSMILPIGIYLYKKYLSKQYLFFSIPILLAILLSFSRAAYLSVGIGFLFLILSSNIPTLFKKNLLLIYFACTITLFLIIIPNPLFSRLQSSLNFQEGSNSGRIEMWQTAIHSIQQKPLLGLGLGSFADKLDPSLGIRNPIYAHNLFLDFGAETGILNIFILLVLIVTPIFSYLKNKKSLPKNTLQKFIATSFVIFLIHSMFETPFFSIQVFPLFLILLALDFSNNPTTKNPVNLPLNKISKKI